MIHELIDESTCVCTFFEEVYGVEHHGTKDGKPYVKIVPAAGESVLERLADEELVSWPNRRLPVFDPIDLAGRDSTEIISESRR